MIWLPRHGSGPVWPSCSSQSHPYFPAAQLLLGVLGWDAWLGLLPLKSRSSESSLLKLEQAPHGRGPCLLAAAERNGEAQMWDSAPGPFPAESEMEEGGDDEGSLRQRAAAARTGQVRLGLILHAVSPFHSKENGLQGLPPHRSSSRPHLPPKSSPQNKIIVYGVGAWELGCKDSTTSPT